MDRIIARFRGDSGEFIPKGAIAARRAIAALRRGTHLGLLADQKMNDGIPVPFFGRLAMTARADAAALMVRINAILEAWIRDRPEQWLWLHKRWPD
jgi:Kdo2-lipid IVA lauroyltransferase/acyltransferase